MNIPIKIAGIGFKVPETVITNDDLTKILDTSDEWIKTRTGIEKRHVLSGNETAVQMGIGAAKKALEKGITTVVFDRGGFIYQGKIKALADAAREAGLEF